MTNQEARKRLMTTRTKNKTSAIFLTTFLLYTRFLLTIYV